MASLALGVKFNPTLGGTTDWVYSSAVTGYVGPAASSPAMVDGKTYRYRAESADLSQWEFGTGVYTASTQTLTRATITLSSTGSKVSFTAPPTVGIVQNVADVLQFDDAMSLTAPQQAQGRANLYAAPFDALAYNGMQINGTFDVNQESGSNAVALTSGTAAYVSDMWRGKFNRAATLAISCQKVAPPGSPPFQTAFSNCQQIKATTGLSSLATGDYAYLEHLIEGYRSQRLGFGGSNASPVTVGFWVYATVAGTMTVTLCNSASNRSIPVNVVINNATTWEYKTVTFAGDQSGTWLLTTNIGLRVRFCFGSGATAQGTNNTWTGSEVLATSSTTNFFASTNNLACVTGVIIIPGLEVPTAARSPFIIRLPGDERISCQRHYWMSSPTDGLPTGVAPGGISVVGSSSTAVVAPGFKFAVPMRITPSQTGWSVGVQNHVQNLTNGTDLNITAFSFQGMSIYGTAYVVSFSSPFSAGVPYGFDVIADARMT